MSDKENNQFPKPPRTRVLIEEGYCEDYNSSPELTAAYKQFKKDDLGGYLVLADFDRDQGRANWVYDKRTGESLDGKTHTPNTPISDHFPNTAAGRELSTIANLLADGYEQQEIAELLHYSTSSVQRLVEEIRAIMADKA